jgi:hypothetical protein
VGGPRRLRKQAVGVSEGDRQGEEGAAFSVDRGTPEKSFEQQFLPPSVQAGS